MATTSVDKPTIFNALDAAHKDWTVFWQTSYLPQKIYTLLTALPSWVSLLPGPVSDTLKMLVTALSKYIDYLKELTSGDVTSCYTYRLFPQIQQITNWAAHFQKLEDFHSRARSGQLPAFSYIEPFWSIAHTTNDNPTYQALFSVLATIITRRATCWSASNSSRRSIPA